MTTDREALAAALADVDRLARLLEAERSRVAELENKVAGLHMAVRANVGAREAAEADVDRLRAELDERED